MASVNPQFYSDCTFPSHLSEFSTVPTVGGVFGGPMWSQESLVPLFDNALLDHVVVSPQSDMTSSYPGGKLETSDFAVPSLSSADYYKVDLCGMTPAGVDHFGAALQPNMCHFREEYCCGFLDDFKPLIPAAGDNSWGGIQGNQPPAIEESNIKVGRYSEEERKERIVRYLKKRNQRNFNKTIKYACRKTLADRRVRVRGRFARNSELCQERMLAMNNDHDDLHNKQESCCIDATEDHILQIKTDDDDWLQEAMASLMYLPYIAG